MSLLPPLSSIPLSSQPPSQPPLQQQHLLGIQPPTEITFPHNETTIVPPFLPDILDQTQQQQHIPETTTLSFPSVHNDQHEQFPPAKIRKTTRQPRKKSANDAAFMPGFAGSLIDLAAAASLFQEQSSKVTLPQEHDVESLYNPLSATIVDPCGTAFMKREASIMHERLLRRKRLIDRLTIPANMTSVAAITATFDTLSTTASSSSSAAAAMPSTQLTASPSTIIASSAMTNESLTSPSIMLFSTAPPTMPSNASILDIARVDETEEQGKRRKKKTAPVSANNATATTTSNNSNNNSNADSLNNADSSNCGNSTESKQKKCHEVLRDENGKPVLPIVIFKGLIVNSLGELNTNPNFQAKKYILPVGFRSTRMYSSLSDMEKKATYVNEILEDDSGCPLFRVTCREPEHEPEVFQADTSSGVWAKIGKRINECKEAVIGKKNFTQLSGPEMFGYGHPTVIRLLQELPGVENLTKYEMQTFEVKEPKGIKKTQKLK